MKAENEKDKKIELKALREILCSFLLVLIFSMLILKKSGGDSLSVGQDQ